MKISITGIQNYNERLLCYLDIEHNGTVYKWQDYGVGNSISDIEAYIQSRASYYSSDIDAKEALWESSPKTRIIESEEGQTEVAINKDEIVKPEIPDYIDKRKKEYPAIVDYLDGIVKGNQTQIDKYIADCLAVKAKYPKP